MISLSDLITPVTTDQAMESLLSTLETLQVPARSWRTGGAYRNILRAAAGLYSGLSSVVAGFAASGFLDTASGGWLTLLAYFVYGVTRPPATFAVGQVLFTNAGGGNYTNAAGTVTLLWVSGKKAYVTTEALNLIGPSTQLVGVQAVEIGAASTVGPGQVDTLQSPLSFVTVTNPASIVGSDELDDEDLRELCRNKLAALSMLGPRGAYAYAVQVAKRFDGSAVDINRLVVIPDGTTLGVTVYCASPSGPPLSSDLDLVRDSVEAWARPDSVTAVVVGATSVAYSRTLTVWAQATTGVAASDIETAVLTALATMIAKYPIGGVAKPPSTQGYLYATNIEGTAKSAHPSIFAVDGAGADLLLTLGQVVTLAATINVRIVS